MVFLKLQFIWARGERFPPETPAGGSEAKFKEQSLPPWLGGDPPAQAQLDNMLTGDRAGLEQWLEARLGTWVPCSDLTTV